MANDNGQAYLDQYTAGMPPARYKNEIPKRLARKVAMVRRIAGSGRWLEVGCGDGLFLEAALRAGCTVQGCDFGLRSSYPDGVRVVAGVLDERLGLPFRDGEFDVVTCWAVIEHLRYPHVGMGELVRVLKPGGYLFCDTPLCGDLAELLVPARSHWLYPPEHLHVLSAKAMRLLVSRAGLQIVRHAPFYERNLPRWIARRARNLLVGACGGLALKSFAPSVWREHRYSRTTQIGDIQLLVARKP